MRDEDARRLQAQLKMLQRRERREFVPIPGLTRSSVRVLAASTRFGAECQPGQLAEELQMTTSNVAAALRELEAAGYVERLRDAADTRRVRVVVTERGQALVARSRAEREEWLNTAVDAVLSEAEQQLLIAAGALIERVAGYERGGAAERSGVAERTGVAERRPAL
jgi:DNA-binding MarR family transcriptional regulator